MNWHDSGPGRDVAQLLGDLELPVAPGDTFRTALAAELEARVALRRGGEPLPADWALCPFDRFCLAEQRLPRGVCMHCPCSHADPLLRLFAGGHTPVHARPCPARVLRAASAR